MSAPGPALSHQDTTAAERGPHPVRVTLSINGTAHDLDVEPRVSLLDALREHLDLTGAKKGCDQGTCGACTVWVEGRRVLACLTLAVACEGREITTIEGLAPEEEPHPGPDHVRGGAAGGRAHDGRRRDQGVDERQHLPLRRLPEHPGRDPRRPGPDLGSLLVRPITYLRATDAANAVEAVTTDPTSDFLAGGTTEVDLLRQEVLH
ncbi:(2Fe-2S)-binding protein, partial [Nocardia asteroides]